MNDLEHPFDVGLAPPKLEEIECPGSQADVLEAALMNTGYNQNLTVDDFYSQTCCSRRLAFMERMFKDQDRGAAMQMLSKRHQIDWKTSDYHVSNQDAKLTWSATRQFVAVICNRSLTRL